jgi:hypothetical protein
MMDILIILGVLLLAVAVVYANRKIVKQMDTDELNELLENKYRRLSDKIEQLNDELADVKKLIDECKFITRSKSDRRACERVP